MATHPIVKLYPLSSYNFSFKEAHFEKDTSVADRFARMRVKNTFYKLPGGRLKPGENEIEGLERKLTSKLGVNATGFMQNWQIGECVAIWWRPKFENLLYPYCPPHITKPKECKKLSIIHMPESECFTIPENWTLIAVPLFELYDNFKKYGTVLSSLPQQLSRFQFNRTI